jgi:hypothetical protein
MHSAVFVCAGPPELIHAKARKTMTIHVVQGEDSTPPKKHLFPRHEWEIIESLPHVNLQE